MGNAKKPKSARRSPSEKKNHESADERRKRRDGEIRKGIADFVATALTAMEAGRWPL